MSLISLLKRSRERFLDRHSDAADPFNFCFSATSYALWHSCRDQMREYCNGLVLDAGSGRAAWRATIVATASGYESIDLAPRGDSVPTWVGDLTSMPDVPAARYDTVVCHQVLEHVPEPDAALAEMLRVLKPGGVLLISVPHLSRRHELPHDYFRFTQEGLAGLLRRAGFADLRMSHYGGIMSFVHHQVSFLFPGLVMGIPVLGAVAVLMNAPFSWLFSTVDRIVDRRGLLACGVLCTARKPP